MTRKHFTLIAAAMADAREEMDVDSFGIAVRTLANALKTTNPNFDRDKFLSACYKEKVNG